MGIYKRGNIYWIRYADADGKVQWESSGSRYHKDAKDKFTERQNEVKEIKKVISCQKQELVTIPSTS